MAERYVYGTKPPKPETVTGNVTNAQISVNVSNQGQSASFTSTITLPTAGSAPFPAVSSVGGSDQNLFLSQGVAIIDFNPNSVGQETAQGGSQANRQNKTGAFYTLYGNDSATGLLAAWAWGVSRYIDVIEASDGSVIDKDALAVMGCSRNGKAAFAIGALDERIALSVPFESGTAGVPLLRAVAQAEVGDTGSGTHCSIRTEYQEPLRQAVQKHLLKNDAAAGATIDASQEFARANPQDWIDWQTPVLE
jgi:hypothetical protein